MKNLAKILLAVSFFSLTVSGCYRNNDFDDIACGDYEKNQLFKEPGGKCYYINSEGKQIYVVDSECDCN